MGSGDYKNLLNFHLHIHHHHHHHHHQKKDMKEIPKGCLTIMVGQGEEQQKFIIPVIYINHPLFMQLLKEAEEEYGFEHQGPINIPCHVEEFRNIQSLIDREIPHHHHHHHHLSHGGDGHGHNPHHHHHVWCFKA